MSGDGEVQIGKCFRPAGGSALGSPTEAVFEVSEFGTEGSIFTHALLNNLTNLLGSRLTSIGTLRIQELGLFGRVPDCQNRYLSGSKMSELGIKSLLVVIFVVSLIQATGAAAADIEGLAKVVDGDTIKISRTKIRLHGIDAPEKAQICRAEGEPYRCGTSATLALAKRIASKPVYCNKRDKDQYGRIIAVCKAGGEDLNAWLVSEGLALAYRRYSTDYTDQEKAARKAKRGLWQGEFVAPWQWRKGERMASEKKTDATPGSCKIKGNINRKSKKIYHLPGGRYYATTKINEAKGERWFCSEQGAKSAGWRPSGQ